MISPPKKSDDAKIVDILGYFWSLPIEDQKQILDILNKGMQDRQKENKK
tara:strand:+ start:106 stop:252 length:147 start_codon:yes stop_codon:yes gene_type:complete